MSLIVCVSTSCREIVLIRIPKQGSYFPTCEEFSRLKTNTTESHSDVRSIAYCRHGSVRTRGPRQLLREDAAQPSVSDWGSVELPSAESLTVNNRRATQLLSGH